MIYFFHGDEEYNIELEINKLRSKLLDKNFSAMNFKTYDNPNFATLVEVLRTQPMMFGNLLIVINCEKILTSTFEDNQLTEISNALEDNTESLNIIFVAKLPPNENKKIDSRKKIFKIISKFAQVQEFPAFKTYKIDDISSWIKKSAKSKDITLDSPAILALIEQAGNNLRQINHELDKLKLMAHPSTNVTKKMVQEICIGHDDLFTLADFLMKNNKSKALLEYKKLLDKKHPLEILAALQTMLRKWIIIKSKAQSLSAFELSKLTGQHEFVVKTTITKMKDTNLKDLVKLKQNLIQAEYRLKTGEGAGLENELELAILNV